MLNKIIFLSLILIFSLTANSQNSKAKDFYKSAYQSYNLMRYHQAIIDLNNAIDIDKKYVDAYLLMGKIYYVNKQINELAKTYERACANAADSFPKFYILAANTYLTIENYKKAAEFYKKYSMLKNADEKFRKKAKTEYLKCIFIDSTLNHPVPFNPKNLGDSVNSQYSEYLPSLSADEQTIVITRKLPKKKKTTSSSRYQEDFYISHKINGVWSKSKPISRNINTDKSEGAQSLTADGNTLYFASCNRRGGMGSCDIYVSNFINGDWTYPKNLGRKINSKYWESQPSISADGKTLYFTSNRPGGFGDADIYVSHKDKHGNWSKPKNLGNKINTSKSEQSPFIHQDGRTLYFCSNGLIGLGKNDLFFSKYNDSTGWQTPVNLGYPINTKGNELSLVVNANGTRAYYASKRKGGKGENDIYYFNLYKEARPKKITYLKGYVYDKKTTKRLKAEFKIVDLKTSEVVYNSSTDEKTGNFLICLLANNKNYAINVSKKGYMFYSENFTITHKDSLKPKTLNIPLQPINVGEITILHNIFFDTDKYELKDESLAELNKLVDFLMNNPDVNIEISGHTDNVGTEEHNLELSNNRAKAVYNYLIENNINPIRISYKGYGEAKPIDTNSTPKGRAKNRRTEFKITKV